MNQLLNFIFKIVLNIFLFILKARNGLRQNIFAGFRKELVAMADDYPSIINNGFRHIEKVIYLAKYFQLNQNNIIIDVGGADGAIAQKFSNAFPKSKIYTFEPIQETYFVLKNNIASYENIIAINKGLGRKSGSYKINIASRITSSSLLKIEQNIKDDFFKDKLKKESENNVKISTLDKEIPKTKYVNIIKIDVQGFELEVLKGGIQTLKRTSLIVLEMQNHSLYVKAPKYFVLDEFLRKNGFTLFDIVPSIRRSNKLYEWDGVYVNNNLLNTYNKQSNGKFCNSYIAPCVQ